MTEAYGIALWDSMHESPRVPFVMPQTVPWSTVAWALNRFMKNRMKQAGNSPSEREPPTWNLTQKNLRVLGEKLFGHPNFDNDTPVQAEKFLKRDGQKSFWDWFYKAVELVEQHLITHWNSGYATSFL